MWGQEERGRERGCGRGNREWGGQRSPEPGQQLPARTHGSRVRGHCLPAPGTSEPKKWICALVRICNYSLTTEMAFFI